MSCKKTFHEKRVMCNTQFFTTLCKMVIKKMEGMKINALQKFVLK